MAKSEFFEQLGIEELDPERQKDEPIYEDQEAPVEDPVYTDEPEPNQGECVWEDPAGLLNTPVQEMSEVEKRLQKAVLYQQWANGNLYDQKTVATIEVEAEFRDFALRQLNKLIGIQQEPEVLVKSAFEDDEITALKLLAQKIVKNPTVLGKKEAPKQPVKPTIKPQPKPVAKPPVAAPKPVGRPKLRQQEVPVEIAPKPPAVVKQPIQQVSQFLQQPQQLQQNRVLNPINQGQQRPRGVQFFKDGENIEENGKKYIAKWVQTSSSAYGPAEEIRLDNMPQKSCILLKNGITVYKTEGEELYKIIKQDTTPKMRPVEAVPFPSNMTLATMSAAEAGANAVNNRFVRETRR